MSVHDYTLLAIGIAFGMYLLLLSDLLREHREDKRRAALDAAARQLSTQD